jgi:predicted GIY-YIG superfamily endonuclease
MKQVQKMYFVYLLECADGSLYVGMTSSLDHRLAEHQQGVDPQAYTFSRRPVKLIWNQEFASEHEAFTSEQQLKGWSRAKKQALAEGDWEKIQEIVRGERISREGRKTEENPD